MCTMPVSFHGSGVIPVRSLTSLNALCVLRGLGSLSASWGVLGIMHNAVHVLDVM